MNTYQIFSLLFGSGVVLALFKYLHSKLSEQKTRTTALELGVQALLRDRLYQMYMHYSEKGFAPLYARDNFENLYRRYHELGANGVMDDYYHKFMQIPTE